MISFRDKNATQSALFFAYKNVTQSVRIFVYKNVTHSALFFVYKIVVQSAFPPLCQFQKFNEKLHTQSVQILVYI